MTDDPFADLPETQAFVPRKIQKRRQHFVMVPWSWVERLKGVKSAQTYRVALLLLYMNWKGRGTPIKLANVTLETDGVSPRTKWRAVNELERLGLISVEHRSRRSPIIRLLP